MKTILNLRNCNNSHIQNLPENMEVRGDVHLKDNSDIYLPNNLKVSADLIISFGGLIGKPIKKELPENMIIGRDLNISGTRIRTIQSGLRVRKELIAWSSGIENILSNVKIGGCLDLGRCDDIDIISNDIKIGGMYKFGVDGITKIVISHMENSEGKKMKDIIPSEFHDYTKGF